MGVNLKTVYADLTMGKIVVVQTNRSNQVAFLQRLPDENHTPNCSDLYIKI